MNYLNQIDYSIIAFYFAILVGLGVYLKKRASASLEDYFLGGRQLPWWMLGISGMSQFLDMSGTMIITSFLFMLGPRGLYIEFRGGAVLVLSVWLLWVGKWNHRSGCITGAEWMSYRFGDGMAGQFARVMKAVAEIIFCIGMTAYLIKGVGMFMSMFLPASPFVCSILLIGIATIYIMISGFYGVVFTDVFQSGIILFATITISVMAFLKGGGMQHLQTLTERITGNSSWLSSLPSLDTSMPKGYEAYRCLFSFAVFYLLRNILWGMGFGDDQRYFGARSDRECGMLSLMWITLMMFRWPMMIGFAVLGLLAVNNIIPDQAMLANAAELIRHHLGDIDKSQWVTALSAIINNPQSFAPEFITELKGILGQDWITKLHLVSFEGNVNPERILPLVILSSIPKGLRGIIIVAMIAAAMTTFASTVNRATGFFTRDLYQEHFRRKAEQKELIYISWAFSIAFVVVSFFLGYTAQSINDIWGWITMSLGVGMIVPMVLRFYWWRFNGWGFGIGMTVGLLGAIAMRVIILYLSKYWNILVPYMSENWPVLAQHMPKEWPGFDERWQFIIMMLIGLVGTLIGTLVTRPTEPKVLENFYKTTRPFGFWKRFKSILPADIRQTVKKEHRNDILALPFVLGWQITLFLLPMQFVIHSFKTFWYTLIIFLVCSVGMYFLWYRNLPEE